VFPSLSQFSKVALTFVGTPAVEEAIVTGGSVTLSLPIGSWNVTADAYIGDVLAAQSAARTIAWTGSGDITGETRFVLVPKGSGNGTLKGVVTPPAEITLGAGSRIAIEGQADMPVTGAMEGDVSLAAGRYYVDVVLENAKTGATAVYRRIVAILSGLTTEVRFAPSAAEFLSGEARAALSSVEGLVFGTTANNAAGIAVNNEDWVNGNIRIAAPGGTTELHFTVYNPNALILSPTNATFVSSAEGSTSSTNLSVFKVNTSALNGNNGAELAVTITAAEQSREGVPITVTVTLAPTFTDLGELTTYFAGLAPNTAATSYAVKLESFNLTNGDLAALSDPLGKVYQTAGQKYFSLDLSDCTGNLGDVTTSRAPKTRLVSCVLPDDLTSIGASVFNNCLSLASITLPDGLTVIGDSAFMNCISLASVALPDSLTTLGNDAFRECSSLETVALNTGLESIGVNAFYNDSALSAINFPAGLKTIGDNAFNGCGLVSVNLPSTMNVIEAYTFANCQSLVSVTIPQEVETIRDSAFLNNLRLVSVTSLASVTTIEQNAFYNCQSLESFNLSAVTIVGAAVFQNCDFLRGPITLVGMTSVPTNLFQDCAALASVTLPEGLASIGDYAFSGCVSLSVTVPASVTSLGMGVFSGVSGTVAIAAGNATYKILEGTRVLVALSAPTTLIQYFGHGDIDLSGVPELTAIGNQAFIYNFDITGITLHQNVITLGTSAFANCTALTSITAPGIQEIKASAFANCTALPLVSLPELTLITGASAFNGCTALTSVSLPKLTSTQQSTFSGCTALVSISLPELTTVYLTATFLGCTSLTTVSLPKLTGSTGTNMFSGCTSLTTITLPTTVTSIGTNAFTNCINLVSVTIEREAMPFTTVTNTSFNNTPAGLKIYVPAASLETYKVTGNWQTYYADKLAAIPSI
jgi:hypothetical protein